MTISENNPITNLEKTKENLSLFNLLSEDFPNGSWQGRVILEIKKEGNAVFLHTSKITGWKAVLLDKIKTFFGISPNSHLPAVVEFLRKNQTSINPEAFKESIKIINTKIAIHNGRKINRYFKRFIPSLIHQNTSINTPRSISKKEVVQTIEKISSVNSQEAAISLSKCFDVIAKTLDAIGFSDANTFLNVLKGKDDLEKAKAIREWMNASLELLSKITILNLSNLALTSLPIEISQLQNLKSLYLGVNKLTNLPSEIGQLKNLTTLDLHNNQLTNLPAEIWKLPKLSCLYIEYNQFISLPTEIEQLQFLKELNLKNNQLTSLPGELGKLQNLTLLDFEHNQLTTLPVEIGQLQKLAVLYIENNQLTTLPAEIGKLSNLQELSLKNNPLTTLPEEIVKSSNPIIARNYIVLRLQQIKKQGNENAAISLSKCFNVIAKTLEINGHAEANTFLKGLEGKEVLEKAKAIREWMDSSPELLSKIVKLPLNDLALTTLPTEIGKLKKLTYLWLWNNQLTTLPVEIGQLQDLLILNLQSNQLTTLPAGIGQLQKLSALYVENNTLTTLPAELGQLHNLQSLSLKNNKLTSLPANIGQLNNLLYLYLDHNQLKSLPAEIGKLSNLKELSLPHNQLTNLPSTLGQLQKINFLFLTSNQLTTLPDEIVNSSNPKIAKNKEVLTLSKKSQRVIL